MAGELKTDEIKFGDTQAFPVPDSEGNYFAPGLTIRDYAAIEIYASLVSKIGMSAFNNGGIDGAIEAAENIVKKLEQTK